MASAHPQGPQQEHPMLSKRLWASGLCAAAIAMMGTASPAAPG